MPKVKDWRDKNHIKANIMYYASLNQLNCVQLAKAVGVSESTFLRALKEPSNMRLGMLQKLSKLFSCQIADLLNKRVS